MRTASKLNKTFSLDRAVLAEVKRTKGSASESERVNNLLRFALKLEKKFVLQQEAATFFASSSEDDAERHGWESAGVEALSRE